MAPRLTLKGPWGPRRIGLLVMVILFGITIWKRQGPITVTVLVLLAVLVAGVGVFAERIYMRRRSQANSSDQPPTKPSDAI
jgi:hypothetical protein